MPYSPISTQKVELDKIIIIIFFCRGIFNFELVLLLLEYIYCGMCNMILFTIDAVKINVIPITHSTNSCKQSLAEYSFVIICRP